MFERLQKPFLTVETGEAYQPIRIIYDIQDEDEVVSVLKNLQCCEKGLSGANWNWYWKDECDDLHFESIDSFQKVPSRPVRLGTISIRDHHLQINLTSFKRACLAVPFFHRLLPPDSVKLKQADFINKVFGTGERLPHGFAELFKDDELEKIIKQRIDDYDKIQEQCENAATAEEALQVLTDYTTRETSKRLPYAERYDFESTDIQDPDILFLSFYIFLRGREIVAIRRWYGDINYSLNESANEVIEIVFGNMNIDILE